MRKLIYCAGEGIAIVGGSRQGLSAIAKLGRASSKRLRLRPLAERAGALAAMFKTQPRRPTVHEADAKKFFAGFGLPVTREILAREWNDVRQAAGEIGWPVALKVVSDHIAHKSEHGLVALAITSEAQLREAHDRLLAAARTAAPPEAIAGLLVQEMVSGGLETFVGVSRDPDFGPVIAVGLGGVGIEVFKDYALRLLPLTQDDAAAMIAELKAYPLLRGARTPQPYDTKALADLIERVGDIAWAERELLGEIDLNPVMLFAAGCGCRIIDALIVPRAATSPKEH